MGKCKFLLVVALFAIIQLNAKKTYGQANELAQLALNIEKLAQFKQILSDLKKGYQIVSKGYTTVKDISKGNFSIHKVFLDGLMEVSPAVKNYRKVAEIIEFQIALVKQYKAAYKNFREQDTFSAGELEYLAAVYKNLFDQSLENLDELITVTTAGKLRMSDDERLAAIDRIYNDMQEKLLFLHDFNRSTALLSVSRAKEQRELKDLREIQGIQAK